MRFFLRASRLFVSLALIALLGACVAGSAATGDFGAYQAIDEQREVVLSKVTLEFSASHAANFSLAAVTAEVGDFSVASALNKSEGFILLAPDKRTIRRIDFTSQKNSLKVSELFSVEQEVDNIVVSPDDKLLALVSFSLVQVVNLQTGVIERQLSRIRGSFTSVAWNEQSNTLALGRSDGLVYVWQLAVSRARDELEQYRGGRTPVTYLKFHPAGRTLLVVERSSYIRIWRLISAEQELGLRDTKLQAESQLVGREVQAINLGIGPIQNAQYEPSLDALLLVNNSGQFVIFTIRGFKVTFFGQLREKNPTSMTTIADAQSNAALFLINGGRSGVLELSCLIESKTQSLAHLTQKSQSIRELVQFKHAKRLWVIEKLGRVLIFEDSALANALSRLNDFKNCFSA